MKCWLLGLLLFLPGLSQGKSNIVFILADDLGWGDLSCYGQTALQTPNLDQLAADGMKFSRHYAGSTVCAPSRCVLMTGLHTGHCRIRGNGMALLKPEDFTVAELLKENGYVTGCFGKWGIGHPPPLDDPNRNGFDQFYGYVNMFHAHNFYPEFLVRNGGKEKLRNVTKAFWKAGDRVDGGPKEGAGVASVKVDYAPELIVKEAVKFIGQNKAKPFFLYLALNTPHANNEGGSDKEQRDGMEVPDYGKYSDKDWPNPEKGFAKMIEDIDTTVAQVREALQKNGIDDTLIIFTSDNGPHQEGQHKMEFFNSNGDLRGMKRDLTDGGVRVPMIAFWDGKIQPGSVTDHLSGFQDFLPTVAEIIGVEPPVDTDGLSYLPTLTGQSDLQKRHEFLYWEFSEKGGKTGVTDGKWKAIRRNFVKNPDAPVELYDLAADPSESTDVAKQYPEVVEKMKQRMGEAHREL